MTATDIIHWFVETSLAVSALIVVILLIRKPFAKLFGAQAAYALWLAPALRLFMPELAILPAPEILSGSASEFSYVTGVLSTGVSSAPVALDIGVFLAASAIFIWIAVGTAWFSMKLEALARFAKTMTVASHPAPEALTAVAKDLAQRCGLKRKIRLRISDQQYGPCVIGVWCPIIFLPLDFERNYSLAEQRLAIAHEIAHIARGDMAATIFAFAIQAIEWPNPLVHYAFRAFRVDQEAACDAAVLARCAERGAAGNYASAILKSTGGNKSANAYGLSLAHPIKERLMLLKNSNQTALRSFAGGLGAFALVTGGLALTANYGYAADDDAQKEKQVEVKTQKHVIIVNGDKDSDMSLLDDGEIEILKEGDGKNMVFRTIGLDDHSDGEIKIASNQCAAAEGEPEPVKLEWTDESGEGEQKEKLRSVICLTGDDAKPENRAAALKKAIDEMEANAKKQEERNRKMIAGLRQQLKEMQKGN